MSTDHQLLNGNPDAMLEALQARRRLSDRKSRLFACAYCRLIWDNLSDKRRRTGVAARQAYADDLLEHDKLWLAEEDAWKARDEAWQTLAGAKNVEQEDRYLTAKRVAERAAWAASNQPLRAVLAVYDNERLDRR